jgi:hypothetical protein
MSTALFAVLSFIVSAKGMEKLLQTLSGKMGESMARE